MNKNYEILFLFTLIIVLLMIVKRNNSPQKKHVRINIPDDLEVTLFYADYCSACKAVKPIFNKLVLNQPINNVRFKMIESRNFKHNKHKNIVKAVPTIILEKNDRINIYNGENNEHSIINHVKRHL